MIPPVIRGGDSTVRSYRFDDSGGKIPTMTSQDGIIYYTQLSSCTDEFKHRFEYFTLPPRRPIAVSENNSEQGKSYYKTKQYKCMPFDQLKDLSGEYVIPGNKTLDTILYEQQQAQIKEEGQIPSGNGISTDQIEAIVAGVAGAAIFGLLVLKIGSWISNRA
jgi:hypothetical protein